MNNHGNCRIIWNSWSHLLNIEINCCQVTINQELTRATNLNKKKNQYMELLNDLQNKSEKSLTNVVNKLSG